MRCDRIAMIALLQPYECEVCSARFSQSNSLNVHKRGVHDKPRFDAHSSVEDKVPFLIHPPSPDNEICIAGGVRVSAVSHDLQSPFRSAYSQ
jgi:hypothetical protein